MKRVLTLTIIMALSTLTYGQIDIRLFYGEKSDAVVVRVSEGSYNLLSENIIVASLMVGDLIYLSRSSDRVKVNIAGREGFLSDSLSFDSKQQGTLALRRVELSSKFAEYKGDFGVFSDFEMLVFINRLDIEDYVAAVVQAEGGYTAHPEYFKTQAVITRTYAWLHMNKHGGEGYDLCDDVHCQVYHGRCEVDAILKAVLSTKGEIITDSDSLLILTPFHSNCGGETAASDQVWLSGKPYLIPVTDPYCAFSRNARWEKKVAKLDFVNYLIDNGYDGVTPVNSFTQTKRLDDFKIGNFSIPLTRIRSDLALRSSLFSFTSDGDSLILKGRGYGHGVGLCQEGAMVMATRGYLYEQIIKFYYNNVLIMDIDFATLPLLKGVLFN